MIDRCKIIREELVQLTLEGSPDASLAVASAQHLQDCKSCHSYKILVQTALYELRQTLPPILNDNEQQRLLSSTIARLSIATPKRRIMLRPVLGLALATLICAVIGIAFMKRFENHGNKIIAGQVAIDNVSLLKDGDLFIDEVLLFAKSDAMLQLRDKSQIQLNTGTKVYINNKLNTKIVLHKGSINLQVKPQPQNAPLLVATAEAKIRVIGTRFTVKRNDIATTTVVTVQQGQIEVTEIATGQNSILGSGKAQRIKANSLSMKSSVTNNAIGATSSTNKAIVKSTKSDKTLAPKTPSIAEIRTRIKARRIKEARILIRRARNNTRYNKHWLAELAIVEAEAELADGHPAIAIESYLTVTRTYPGTTQAEDAFYAAAQLAIDHSPNKQRGLKLLKKYITNYPQGRFHNDAVQLLRALEARK
ncbi:MAG: FecR domain-containing protein [Deltaproteobacteria bacterium]|nr:FecR domain-containing protein [Deltaproteobacteria bacterium]